MKTTLLAAVAVLALSTGSAFAGSNNTATVTQIGTSNSAAQDQYNVGATASTYQNGTSNSAVDLQQGGTLVGSNYISQDAEGSNNHMTSTQTSNFNGNIQTAYGSGNTQTNTQINSGADTSRGNNSDQVINGSNNTQSVSQGVTLAGSAEYAMQQIGTVFNDATTHDNHQTITQNGGNHNDAWQYISTGSTFNTQTATQTGNTNQSAQGVGYTITDAFVYSAPTGSGDHNTQTLTSLGDNNKSVQFVAFGSSNSQTANQIGNGNINHQGVH